MEYGKLSLTVLRLLCHVCKDDTMVKQRIVKMHARLSLELTFDLDGYASQTGFSMGAIFPTALFDGEHGRCKKGARQSSIRSR